MSSRILSAAEWEAYCAALDQKYGISQIFAEGFQGQGRTKTDMVGVREYGEEFPVELEVSENGRLVVSATNEGGHSGTSIDLLDLVAWLWANCPALMEKTP